MTLLGWALLFLVVAVVAGYLGFGGVAHASAGMAKIVFYVAVAAFVVGLVMHLLGKG